MTATETVPDTYPTPDELLSAYRTLEKLSAAIYYDEAWEGERMRVWEKVIEAKMGLAIATSAIAEKPYLEVWEQMHEIE